MLLVANWKSNPDSVGRAKRLAKGIEKATPRSKNVHVVIAPPDIFLEEIGKVIKKTKLGAQDVFWGNVGPYTGLISWHQLKHLKVEYVIVGHSERRRLLNETDGMINKKVKAALASGLNVILCVGEPLTIRKKGIKAAEQYIKTQLMRDLKGINYTIKKTHTLIIAYEPLWAIGTGQTDTPEDAIHMATVIKKIFYNAYHMSDIPVLYGGSVNAQNATDFLKQKEMYGLLIGGASLKPSEFAKIIKIASC